MRVLRLQHRRQAVSDGCAGGGHHPHVSLSDSGNPHREEGCAPLINPHMDPHIRPGNQRQGQGRVAGTWADHHVINIVGDVCDDGFRDWLGGVQLGISSHESKFLSWVLCGVRLPDSAITLWFTPTAKIQCVRVWCGHDRVLDWRHL